MMLIVPPQVLDISVITYECHPIVIEGGGTVKAVAEGAPSVKITAQDSAGTPLTTIWGAIEILTWKY